MTRDLPRRIAILGAGPCGAGAAKAFLAEGGFDVKIFEKRNDFGGLWNYTKEQDIGLIPIPCESPHIQTEPVFSDKTKSYVWAAPVYDTLDTNVPKDIMSYSSMPFLEDLPLFPHRSDVEKYMKAYAEPLRPYTVFDTKVVSVSRNEDDTKWAVKSQCVGDNASDTVAIFDAVVIATGNYELPYIPNREGLQEWNAKFPGSIESVKNYRSTDHYKDIEGNILVVGNSALANDLCYQLALAFDRVIYKLRRSENNMPSGSSSKIIEVPDIARFDAVGKRVEFVDGSALENVDKVVFATGYLRTLPFLFELNQSDKPIVTDGHKLHGIYKHTLLYNYPNLAICGAARYILPTRTAESQGSWIAKVWSGALPQPSKDDMVAWEMQRVKDTGGSKAFHDLYFPDDVHYANELNKEILEVNTGLIPFIWDREQISIRGAIKGVKEAYIKYRADTGKIAKSYKELVDSGYLKSFVLTDAEMKQHGF